VINGTAGHGGETDVILKCTASGAVKEILDEALGNH